MTAIEVASVSKQFGDLLAIDDISLTAEPRSIVTLLGPSGCGKTTLLRIIAGLEAPSSGEVRVLGGLPTHARAAKQIGMVPQSPALLPWRTVGRNARLLLDINRSANRAALTNRPDRVDVDELLHIVGLDDFVDAYPHELSGGMQQRVGLVRAFALGAPLLLLDEPFAALDEITRADMRHLLAQLCEAMPTTVLFVTHSIAEAVFLSDRVHVMSARPGRLIATHDIGFEHPRLPELEDSPEFFAVVTTLRDELRRGSIGPAA